MKSVIEFWQVAGFFFIYFGGTLFHFLYDWTGRHTLIGLISPINESVWEHLKLAFYPAILFGCFEDFALKGLVHNFLIAKTFSVVTAILAIIIIFYSYTYLLGKNYFILDLLTFAAAIALGQYASYLVLTAEPFPQYLNTASIWILLILTILFSVFTFYPPKLPIFKNKPDGTYGIYNFK